MKNCAATEILRKELARFPVTFSFGRGGRHPYLLIVDKNGTARRFIYTDTRTTPRGLRNMRAALRRFLRELGTQSTAGET